MQLELNRRRFLIGGSAAMLASCLSVARRDACSPLPRVRLDPDRVTRTYAGLRPYRGSGFVVRRDQLGDKAVVHNYGHGGAGITLSWGTSQLATELGLSGHSGPVAVLGCGVMGLTTARLVQQAGFPVTIYAAALPPETTSNLAGGQWGPTGHYRESQVSPEWRAQYKAALATSWRQFQQLDRDRYGIHWLPTYTEATRVGPPGLEPYYPGSRVLRPDEHPFAIDEIAVYRTMYVEVGRYLNQLAQDFVAAGGHMQVRRFGSPDELAQLPQSLVFNCTGLGARELFGDLELEPARGQIAVLAPQPEVQYAYTLNGAYMFPRADGIILGGTFERGEWSTTPDPQAIAGILAHHRKLIDDFRCTA